MASQNFLAQNYIFGVYIPSALLIGGAAVFKAEWIPFAVAFSAALGGLQFFLTRTITSRPTIPRPNSNPLIEGPTNPTVLKPDEFQTFPISEKKQISHNTAIYRFKLPTDNSILGLPIGQHISLAATLDVTDPKTAKVERKEVVRSYTPISSDVEPGYFDLIVKSYPTGNISRHLATLNVGDTMKVKGPKGAMVYTPNMVRHFGMIAGGTGITPMLQVARAVQRGRKSGDKTKVDLIFANVNPEDILLKEDLDKLAREDPDFNVYYVLNNPPEKWAGGVGFVTADMIKVSLNKLWFCNCNSAEFGNRNVFQHRQTMSRSWFAVLHLWFPPSRRPLNHWASKRRERSANFLTRSSASKRRANATYAETYLGL